MGFSGSHSRFFPFKKTKLEKGSYVSKLDLSDVMRTAVRILENRLDNQPGFAVIFDTHITLLLYGPQYDFDIEV
jgi:hypothetical protein